MSLDACAEIVARGDPDRFLSAMTAPLARRGDLLALYAFNVEVSRAPWVTAEPMIAEMRLQWWRDALAEIAAGGAVRAHEVAQPLAEVLRGHGLPVDWLVEMIEARSRCDVQRSVPADSAALWAHVDVTAGHLMVLGARCLGAGPEAEPAVRAMGQGAGMAAWLAAVPALRAGGIEPLAGMNDAAVAGLAREGLERLARARRDRARVPRRAAPALLAGWRAAALLKQAVRAPGRVAGGRLVQSEFARRASLMLRAASGRW